MITRKIKRFLFLLLLSGTLSGFAIGLLTMKALQPNEAAAGVVFDGRLMSGERPLDVASLREMVGEAVDEAAALRAVVSYYEANAERLAGVFREDNDLRLRGLFGMYIVHVSQPYNTIPSGWADYSLIQFLDGQAVHCGLYALAQSKIYTALGLRWHNVTVNNGWHGLIEAEIDGQWETFDSTSNVWLSVSVGGLVGGLPRDYREFYTPIWDASAGEVYRRHYDESGGYLSVADLRAGLPLWGLRVMVGQWYISASG